MARSPAIIGIPVLFLLLFVYVFGGALKESVKLASAPAYVDYVLAGLIIMTAAAGLIRGSTSQRWLVLMFMFKFR